MSRETAYTLIYTGLFSVIGSLVLMRMFGRVEAGFETVLLCGGLGLLLGGLVGMSAVRGREAEAADSPDQG